MFYNNYKKSLFDLTLRFCKRVIKDYSIDGRKPGQMLCLKSVH
jgi:hypothetical protein